MTKALLVAVPLLGAIVAAALLNTAACGSNNEDLAEDASTKATVIPVPGSGPAGTGLNTGLACDVQAVIENRCIACHDGSGAPPRLLDYDTMIAASTKDPTKPRVVVAVELMKGQAMPPRPAARPEPDEIQSFEDWIAAGTPRETKACTDPPPPAATTTVPDGGGFGPDGGGVCTSGKRWTMGNQGSPEMHPGNACNACHQVNGGPNLRFAGTVFPTAHEDNDCNGVAPPPALSVVVTDSRNNTFTMPVNAAGNFSLESQGGQPPKAPFKAKVTDGTKTRAMNGSVTAGDCNSCHTAFGANGAPGRIMAP
jgi:hypothetical protein